MIIQSREITPKDIALIREMISFHPSWRRTRISKELAILWRWRADNGQLKDIACRSLLLKLEKRGYINLPARKKSSRGNKGKRTCFPCVSHSTSLITDKLKEIAPFWLCGLEIAPHKYLLCDSYRLLGQSSLIPYIE